MQTWGINDYKLIANNKSEFRKTTKEDFMQVLSKEVATAEKSSGEDTKLASAENKNQGRGKYLVSLGTVTKDNPTVSNLLIRNNQFGKDCWKIIHGGQNKDKPFTKIAAGTEIFIDSETKEIVWGSRRKELLEETAVASNEKSAKKSLKHSSKKDEPITLASAVKPYMGKSYDEVDCYELVVGGLKKMGVQYTGRGGLREKLFQMAEGKGLPKNAYVNGEGIIEASGSKVYSRSIPKVTSSAMTYQAKKVISELEPILEKGMILSFSTRSRGHTGVISKKDNDWTFINSGDMDHNLDEEKKYLEKGVGEEPLKDEIMNWFEVAATRNEHLNITVGRINDKKLAALSGKKAALDTSA